MRTHGERRSREYRAWCHAKTRCFNPNYPKFADYGGRGITMCQRWRESFAAFLSDMGRCPAGMTLDRFPNVNGDYEPGNCRWATWTEQAVNRRVGKNARLITKDGITLPIAEWARRIGVSDSTIRMRIRCGWSADRLLIPAVPKTGAA